MAAMIDECLPDGVVYVLVAWCTQCDNGRGQPCTKKPQPFGNEYSPFHAARQRVGLKWRRDDSGRVRNETLVAGRCYCSLKEHCPTPERHR